MLAIYFFRLEMPKALNGQESSLLALLAQISVSKKLMSVEEIKDLAEDGIIENVLSDLKPNKSAYRIGKLIMEQPIKKPSKAEIKAAKGFIEWVENLGKKV